MEMVKITHNDYEKISDIILWLSNEYVLKFNVELNRRNDRKGKINFHNEFGYTLNGEYRINITRQFSCYLSIESLRRDTDGNKLQIRIGMENIYFFKMKLQGVISWFTSHQHNSLFAKKDGNIIILSKVNPISINVQFGNYIEFEPTVQTFNNGEQNIGVRTYLNSDGVSFFMNVNTLLALGDFINSFNMYQSAQLMMNYIGRPENGTNYSGYGLQQQNQYQKQSGFFDRVKAEKKI